MKIALIDCGTNTFHLLIAEKSADLAVKFILREQVPVMLSESGLAGKEISQQAWQRGLNCLQNFNAIIRKVMPDRVIAYGTEALRKASNSQLFIDTVKRQTGIAIQIIDGLHEARLIYEGVRRAVPLQDMELIMDIGGGSTELIVADENRLHWLQSYQAGASLLREQFRLSDPITPAEIDALNNHFHEIFKTFLQQWRNKVHVLNGSAGSFETLAVLTAHQSGMSSPVQQATCVNIPLNAFRAVYNNLLYSTRQQRLQMKGLPDFRVDTIIPACILLNYMIRELNIKMLRYSAYSLKEGMLFEMLKNNDS
jgi:exopolyphosphatase/guanosine-5'-triphosphate,3'-diphosphate pyrophosphatase